MIIIPTWHLIFGQDDVLAAPSSQGDVGDLEEGSSERQNTNYTHSPTTHLVVRHVCECFKCLKRLSSACEEKREDGEHASMNEKVGGRELKAIALPRLAAQLFACNDTVTLQYHLLNEYTKTEKHVSQCRFVKKRRETKTGCHERAGRSGLSGL